MSVEHDRIWGLARGHVVRGLLKLDHLLVIEDGAVVDDGHAVECLAARANCWLSNTPTVNHHSLGVVAHVATEKC